VLDEGLHYVLQAGSPDMDHFIPVRMGDWPSAIFTASDWSDLRDIWVTHGDDLRAEAEAAGFRSAGALWFDSPITVAPTLNTRGYVDRVLPADLPDTAARQAWAATFAKANEY
jgi:hypothetical protein